jgi:hypothetical protein
MLFWFIMGGKRRRKLVRSLRVERRHNFRIRTDLVSARPKSEQVPLVQYGERTNVTCSDLDFQDVKKEGHA